MFKNRESIDEFIQLNGIKAFLDLMILDGEIKTYEYCGLTEAVKFKENNKMPTKHIMTRAEAIECFTKHMPWTTGSSAEKVINFYVAAGMLEIKEDNINWNMPLYIIARNGIKLDVVNLGHGYKGKLIVQIEDDLTVDGTLPKVYVPDNNGYVVQFDACVFN